jgi:BlaI family penicillinase repressor
MGGAGLFQTQPLQPTTMKKPTDAELAILRVLWARGPSTVRQVLDALTEERTMGYTTVLKLLQIMTDKHLVARDESDRTHIYSARYSEAQTQRQLVDDLLDRAFGGSAMQLVMQALSGRKTSRADLAEIRRLLDEREGDKR